MIKWIKSLIVDNILLTNDDKSEVEPIVKEVVEDTMPVEVTVPETPPIVSETPSKTKTDKYSVEDFEGMSKLDIDIWARNELKINLDRRQSIQNMIQELNNLVNKEN